MITVLGASGHIGSKVASLLLDQGLQVRVVARDPRKLEEFTRRGAEARTGDQADPVFLADCMRGSSAVFTMIPPNYQAISVAEHAAKMSKAIATAISDSGVKWVVNLSSLGAHLSSGTGQIQGLYEHEQRLNRLEEVNLLHLRPTYFMENLLMNVPMIKSQNRMGSALRADLPIPLIATQDVAYVAARRLVLLNFKGHSSQLLLGQRDLTMNEVARIVSEVLARPISYECFDYGSTRDALIASGFSPDTADQFVEMSAAFNSGRISAIGLRAPENTTPTRFEDFALIFLSLIEPLTPRATLDRGVSLTF